MIMASGMNFGTRKSLPHYLGICIGFPAMVVLVGLGFGFIFDEYPLIHEIIKIVGIVYLVYLSWLIANSAPKSLDSTETQPISFWQAVLFQWVIMVIFPARRIYLEFMTIMNNLSFMVK